MRVGAISACPNVRPAANGAGEPQPNPLASTILRTSENPLECTPALPRLRIASPGATTPGSSEPRSAAPTENPAKS